MGDGGDQFAQAVETFMGGFAFTRSFTHPYLIERLGETAWVMRDGPRTSGDWRTEEFVAFGVGAEAVDELVGRHARRRWAVSYLVRAGEDEGKAREEFKKLGYRLGRTETFLRHGLKKVPRPPQKEMPAGVRVERVMTQELADRLAKAARAREILPEHLAQDAPLRQYVAVAAGEEIVGWVRSIVVGGAAGEATWCSNMRVAAAWQRKGIGSALMCRLLRDDRAGGAKCAVTLSSHAGENLYPKVGYEGIGKLLLYTRRE